jgi:antitoxin VapB
VAALCAALPAAAAQPEPVTRRELLDEAAQKVARVQAYLKSHRLGGALITRVDNFSWVTAGAADNHIVITSETGAASLLILDDGRRFAVASNSEMPRLLAEDLQGLGYQPLEYKWYEDKIQPDRKLALIRGAAGERRIGTDVPYAGFADIAAGIQQLRYSLTDTEIRKYRWLGRESTEAVIAVARRIRPGVTEREMEAMASDELMRRGIRPTVLLMGADDRVLRFRHAVPTGRKLEHYAMINVCARRWGLVISTCRFVHFGPAPADLQRRFRVSAEMTARYLAASKPGATAGDILAQARGWYRELGFDGELELHHQGGAIGYAERDWVAVPGSRETIHDREAVAWNPIVQGALSFDTFLISGGTVENLDEVPDWPMLKVTVNGREVHLPALLER